MQPDKLKKNQGELHVMAVKLAGIKFFFFNR